MFEPRKLRVSYSVEKPDGEMVEFVIRLDEHGILEDLPTSGPAWTRMEGQRCADCTAGGEACRAALAIAPVVEAFIGIDSLQQVRARASLPNCSVETVGPVSKVVSSIMGLMMAGSGCPKIAPFRAMAMHHQPFSTLEDTVIRAAGFMLLGRWAHRTLADDNPFAPLIDAWEQLEEVNLRIGRSLRAHCATDAALNGLVNLDMFAKAGIFGLESALAALRPALLAWDLGLAANAAGDHAAASRPCPSAAVPSGDGYADFYEFAPVGYLALDERGSIDQANLAAAKMLGIDRAALRQCDFGAFVVAAEIAGWQRQFSDALAREAELDCELVLQRPDETQISVRLSSLRLPQDGPRRRLHLMLTDITASKQADAALKVSEQRFRDIVNTTDGIVWEADATTFTFTFISQQAERLLGHPAADWLRPGFWVANLHPDDQLWAPDYCASCTRRGEPHDFEYRFIAKDGRTVWLHDIVTVVTEHGAPRWLRGIMVDVTQRKQAEMELRDLTASLEARIGERTKQLRALSGELTMTEERERRLLAQDLHDNLGQLLAIAKIKLTSLAAGPHQSSIDEVVALVDQADQSVRSITLQLSPPILHALGFVPALDLLADEMEKRYGISVQVDSYICPERLGDEIEAVLYRSARELLINVAKHARVGDASVSCLCDKRRLTLVVSDDGCGFDAANLAGVAPGHSSFGLRSIFERIANIGGEMDIDSSPGNGTTIALTLPCAMRHCEYGACS